MSGVDWLGYTEEITIFNFRVQDGITIPKEVRERAFSLQVDVEIVSTIGNDYVNNKSAPAYGFYGYAVLVFRDYSQIQIPINQPRQRLYYGRCPDAYVGWKRLHSERESRLLANEFIVALGSIWGALGLEDFTIEARQCPVWEGFEELPLREVYVKTRFGTQFRLEVSRWIPIIRTGDPDGCNYDGKSQQIDGDKDSGLPDNGSQPQKANDPSNPYDGLDPVTPDSEQLEWSNSKLANLDDPNPDNEPSNQGDQKQFRASWQIETYGANCTPVQSGANEPFWSFDFVASSASEFQLQLGEVRNTSCPKPLRNLQVLIAGVVVNEQFAAPITVTEFFNLSIVELAPQLLGLYLKGMEVQMEVVFSVIVSVSFAHLISQISTVQKEVKSLSLIHI